MDPKKEDIQIKENVELSWTESFNITESGKDQKGKWLSIGGVALKPGVSRNKRNWTIEHIEENDGAEVSVFVEHEATASNVIGKTKLFRENESLRHAGKIRNTVQHPDVVEKVEDGLLSVSVGASAKKVTRKATNEGYQYNMEGVNIRHLGIVGSPGVESASIEYALAESFNPKSASNVDDQKIDETKELKIEKEIVEESKMDEEQMKKIQSENDELKKQLVEMAEKRKEDLVESVIAINKDLNKNDLMKESEDTLKMRKEYETKLKENEEEEKPADGEEKKEEPSGNAEVNNEEPEKEKEPADESLKGYILNEKSGEFVMSEATYKKFNEEVRKYE